MIVLIAFFITYHFEHHKAYSKAKRLIEKPNIRQNDASQAG